MRLERRWAAAAAAYVVFFGAFAYGLYRWVSRDGAAKARPIDLDGLHPQELPDGAVPAVPKPPARGALSERELAVRYWDAGILYFQKGEYEKAREQWALCQRMDPSNDDCPAGLKRVAAAAGERR